MIARKVAEWRAAQAARQLLYHRRLMEWISRKTEENEDILEAYLVGSEVCRVVLSGGYLLERAGDGRENSVEVSEPITGTQYEQLHLPAEAFERSYTK